MCHLFFVCIWLKNSIFGEFSNIYLLSAQNRVKWRHKIQPIAKKFRPILIFFARDDAKLMPGEVCQVSCRYSNKWRSYFRKTEGGVGSDPPPGGGGLTDLPTYKTPLPIWTIRPSPFSKPQTPRSVHGVLSRVTTQLSILHTHDLIGLRVLTRPHTWSFGRDMAPRFPVPHWRRASS